jgi:hypothetical protein
MMGEPSSVLMAANRSPGQNCSRIVLRMLVWPDNVVDRCAQESAQYCPGSEPPLCRRQFLAGPIGDGRPAEPG